MWRQCDQRSRDGLNVARKLTSIDMCRGRGTPEDGKGLGLKERPPSHSRIRMEGTPRTSGTGCPPTGPWVKGDSTVRSCAPERSAWFQGVCMERDGRPVTLASVEQARKAQL